MLRRGLSWEIKGTLACSFFLSRTTFLSHAPYSGICLPSDLTRCDLSAVHLSGLSSPFPQVQRPRIWRPAAPCPDCAYLNDETYNFCQSCGFRKELVSAQPMDPSAIDLDSINNRLSQLAKNKLSKPYEKQKSSLHRELLSVLASLPTPKTLHSATPSLERQSRQSEGASDAMPKTL